MFCCYMFWNTICRHITQGWFKPPDSASVVLKNEQTKKSSETPKFDPPMNQQNYFQPLKSHHKVFLGLGWILGTFKRVEG